MAKTTYNVNENSSPAKDGSFRSCLCAMLVFVAICIILMLAAWPWRSARPSQQRKEDFNDPKQFEKFYGNVQPTNTSYSDEIVPTTKIIYPETEKTQKTTTNSILFEQTTNKVKTNVVENTESSEATEQTMTESIENNSENTPVTTSLKTPLQITTETTEQATTKDIEIKSESTPISTTLPYVYTKLVMEVQNISEDYIPTSTIITSTETNIDLGMISVSTPAVFTNPTESISYTNEEVFSTTTTDSSTIFQHITSETTTETTTPGNVTDYIIKTNISRSKGTHEILTEESTDSPQEEETDDFDVIETDNFPLRAIKTTTSLPTVNPILTTKRYNNGSDDDQEKLTTTKSKLEWQNRNETEDATQKETIPFYKQHRPVCQDSGCKTTATRMLTRIKHSGDPCEDFYEYACGGDNFDNIAEDNWKRIALKLQGINKNSPIYLIIFQKFYQSCVSFHSDYNYEQRVKEAKGILHSVSPLYDRTQEIPEQLTLTELLTRLLQVGSSPLFDISVDADKQHFVFQILPAKVNLYLHYGTKLPNKREKCFREVSDDFNSNIIDMNVIYDKYRQCLSNHSDYLNTVQRALNVFGEFSHLPEYNATWHISDIRTAIEWEILSILDKFEGFSLRHDVIARNYQEIKLSQLQERYSLIDWKTLFSNLAGQSINEDVIVHLYFQDYFNDLFNGYALLARRQQNNALLGMFAHDLYTTFVLPVQADDYENFCLRQTSHLLPGISSVIYLQNWPTVALHSAQKDLQNTFAIVKAHMTMMLKDAKWLDKVSKSSILNKLDNIQIYSGNINLLKNDSYFNNKYKDIHNANIDTYSQYTLALIKLNMKHKYSLLGTEIENSMQDNIWWYYLTPYEKNPIAIYSTNSIVAPLGMVLNFPKKIPRYIHLAAIGYPIARALSHHFDPVGINYGSELTETAKKSYNLMKSCAFDKAAFTMSHTFNDKDISFRIVGNLSLNERIAEDMALELVIDMSKDVLNSTLLPWICDTYSKEKVFFLNIAQQHCQHLDIRDYMLRLFESEHMSPSLVVKNMYANSNGFEDTFHCPLGSKMNHPIKCMTLFSLIEEEDYE